jgi:hypothetical protein
MIQFTKLPRMKVDEVERKVTGIQKVKELGCWSVLQAIR